MRVTCIATRHRVLTFFCTNYEAKQNHSKKDEDMQTNLSLNFFIFVVCDVCMCEALLFVLHICADISLAVVSDGSGLEKC